MEKRKVKWGIMGPGGISRQFAGDLPFAEGAELVAVGGRDLAKAQKFAEEFNVPRAYGSCEELAQDPDVEVVYVGTLHTVHHDNIMTLLKGGKSVLCEKPFTINALEAQEAINYARENGLFLMEAMWTRYLPPIVKVREWIAEGLVGEIQLVEADFGFDVGWQPDGRLLNINKGGGAIMDAGIYPISFASMIYGSKPTKIMSSVFMGETGVDERFSLLCEYEGNRKAQLNSSVRLKLANDAFLFGTKGYIHVPNFLFGKSAKLFVDGKEVDSYVDDRTAKGYNFEAEEVMNCLRAGKTESDIMPLDETLAIMQTLDEVRQQWNFRFPFEK